MEHLGKSRNELFDLVDKPALKPLLVIPYEFALWKKAKISIDYHVEYDDVYYSVPCWEAEKIKDPDFLAAAEELEPGYQVARLRVIRGLTQAQLAEMVGTRQPSIARLENGTSAPSLSFLTKVAEALGAKIEFKLIPDTK